jgi:D-aspartate ligase
MGSKVPAVILNMGINGLSVARNLSQHGVPVICVDEKAADFSKFSRYCKRYYQFPNSQYSNKKFPEFLIELAKGINDRPVLIPTSDDFVLLLAEHGELLRKYYRFNVSPFSLVQSLVNKEEMYALAGSNGIPIPFTFFPKDVGEVEEKSKSMTFPSVLKPIYSHISVKKIGKKLLVAHNREELIREYQRMETLGGRVMVQELIEGKDDRIYLYAAYCKNEKADPLFEFSGKKLRQFPPQFGTASLVISSWDEDVVAMGRRFLKGIEYEGVAGVEFKKDLKDQKFKLIEINGRLCQWHGITRESGVDLCSAYYFDLIDENISDKPLMTGKKWMFLTNDFISSMYYIKEGSLSFSDWIKSFYGINYIAEFELKDPLPLLVSCVRLLSAALKKSFRYLQHRIGIVKMGASG